MFFKKIFSKSPEQILQKADSLFTDERYSEARQYYHDALEKMPDSGTDQQTLSHINSMISKCGNNLACMNIAEAEAAIRSGDSQKAADYLELSLEQADDVSVREKAEGLISSLTEFSSAEIGNNEHAGKHGCASCSTSHNPTPEPDPILPEHLHSHEQFQLLVNTLPGDLPQRYSSLGEEFASAYLLAHSDDRGKALNIFRQLLSDGENDIILCEAALLEYREGRTGACESLLSRALNLNPDNPLCNLSLAQLFADAGRLDEAAVLLKSMMDRVILYDQSLIMLADVYTMQGDHEGAVTLLSCGLQTQTLKKASAERLVHILASQGRDNEAEYLIKTYLKGCC